MKLNVELKRLKIEAGRKIECRISPVKVLSTPRAVDPLPLWCRVKCFNKSPSSFGD